MDRKEFTEKYAEVLVKFSDYYKYSFTYMADLPGGYVLTVSVGGNADEIYRFSVSSGDVSTVKDLEPYSGEVYKDGKEIESFYDY